MSAAHAAIGEADLAAHVDGRLPAERAAVVDAYLSAHPDERARLEQYRAQQQALRAVFMAQSAEPIPGQLRVARLRAAQRRRRNWQLGAVAAAVLLVLVGGIGGWAARGFGLGVAPQDQEVAVGERAVLAEALAAYEVYVGEVRHPVTVGADQEAHLVQWLSKRLGRPLIVPNLNSEGFQLVGGSLLPSESGPAAQFMYQKGNTRLTLYERAASGGETGFRHIEENGIGAFYWWDQDFAYALTGKIDREQLLRLSELVYKQLAVEPGKPKVLPPQPPGKPS